MSERFSIIQSIAEDTVTTLGTVRDDQGGVSFNLVEELRAEYFQ